MAELLLYLLQAVVAEVKVGEVREAVEGVRDPREQVAGEVERRQRAAPADLVGQRREAVAAEVELRQHAQVAERGWHVAQEVRGEVWLVWLTTNKQEGDARGPTSRESVARSK